MHLWSRSGRVARKELEETLVWGLWHNRFICPMGSNERIVSDFSGGENAEQQFA